MNDVVFMFDTYSILRNERFLRWWRVESIIKYKKIPKDVDDSSENECDEQVNMQSYPVLAAQCPEIEYWITK